MTVRRTPCREHRYVPPLFLFVPLILLLFGYSSMEAQTSGGPVTLSSRVGDTIDEDERRYFNLFTGIGDFSSSRIEKKGSDSIRIVIVRGRGREDTSLVRSDSAFRDLQRAIDHYEDLFAGKHGDINWTQLDGIISPNSPFGEHPLSLVVTTREGEVQGTVVLADDRYLAIAPDSLARDWPRLGEHARIFTPDEILRVHVERSDLRTFFYEFDIPVSGNDTIYRNKLIPALKDRAVFYQAPSPELQRAINRRMAEPRVQGKPGASVAEVDNVLDLPRFSVAVGIAGRLDWRSRGFNAVVFGGDRLEKLMLLPTISLSRVKAEFDPLPFLRIGASYFLYSDPSVPDDINEDYQRIHGTASYEVAARIVLMRPQGVFARLRDRAELSIGGAMIWRSFNIESRVTSSPLGSSGYHMMYYDSRDITGKAFMAGFACWLRHFLSVELEGRYSIFDETEIDEMKLHSRNGGVYTLKTHQKHTLSLDAVDVGLWVRVHF